MPPSAQPGMEDHPSHAEQTLPPGQQTVEREDLGSSGFLTLGFLQQSVSIFLVGRQQGPGQARQRHQVLQRGETPGLHPLEIESLLAEPVPSSQAQRSR